jgi:hypothetical protein
MFGFKLWIYATLCPVLNTLVGTNARRYARLERKNQFAQWLDRLLFSEEQRYEREAARVVTLLLLKGREKETKESRLAIQYVERYGYGSCALSFDHGLQCFVPRLLSLLNKMVQKGILACEERELRQPAALVGPERACQIISYYTLASGENMPEPVSGVVQLV